MSELDSSQVVNNQASEPHQLLQLTAENKITEIQNLLQNDRELDLSVIMDQKQYNILHKATLNNQLTLINLFLEHQKELESFRCRYETEVQQKLKGWLDQQTDEGFTTLHFASFRGNLEIIQLALKYGASEDKTNSQGLSVLHIAAQGDQPKSLAFFIHRGMDAHVLDAKGGTALHWGAYLGCENAVNFLCAQKVQLNIQDVQGFTPLHLAVMSGNSRVVRKLLIKGSDRNIEDFQQKLPITHARENEFTNIESMLKLRWSLAEKCNIKPAFKPINRSIWQIFVFIILYIFGYMDFVVFVYPVLDEWELIVYSVFFVVVLVFFFMVCFFDPGYYRSQACEDKKKDMLVYMALLQKKDASQICMDCRIVKPPRSRHCDICKKCVAIYDHHCPWINNCVGKGNHRFFLIYITLTWINLLIVLIGCGRYFATPYRDKKVHPWDWFRDLNDSITVDVFRLIFEILCVTISALFFFPLCILLWVQINNFLTGQTTHERFSNHTNANNSQAPSHQDQESLEASQLNSINQPAPPKKGRSLLNCYMFCYQHKPEPDFALEENQITSRLIEQSFLSQLQIQNSKGAVESQETDSMQTSSN